MFYGVIVFIFVIVCLLLMGIILMQSSQSGGMGAAMGGGAMNTAFGGQGADKLLVRVTSGLAVTFMVLGSNPPPRTLRVKSVSVTIPMYSSFSFTRSEPMFFSCMNLAVS